jgi:hypothetical protein
MSRLIVAIDFDGTIVEHKFPKIGFAVPGAFDWMKKFQDAQALLILLTMRSDGREDGGNYLKDAVDFCKERGIEFWAHNNNPEQATWTASPKVYAHCYIDDAAIGCPLLRTVSDDGFMADWKKIGPMVMKMIKARRKAFEDD